MHGGNDNDDDALILLCGNLGADELGNEPGCWGSHGGNVPASVHAQDFGILKSLLANAYPQSSKRPLVIGVSLGLSLPLTPSSTAAASSTKADHQLLYLSK